MNADWYNIESKRGLTQLIHFTRKWKACNKKQRIRFLARMPQILSNHGIDPDTILSNFINPVNLSPALFKDVLKLFPSDKTLRLKDTVYESRFVVVPQTQNQAKATKSLSKRRKKLPLNLLQIPTDLQCHLFHFLNLQQLCSVQRTCRALYITARDPRSLHLLHINSKKIYPHILDECYSKPTIVRIDKDVTVEGNPIWSHRVRELIVTGNGDMRYPLPFVNLRKCNIHSLSSTYLFLSCVHSYETLIKLDLDHMILTEAFVVHLEKFQNLQVLSLGDEPVGRLTISETRPISLINLQQLSFQFESKNLSPVFERILVGSHPETVHIESLCGGHVSRVVKFSDSILTAFESIKCLHVVNVSQHYLLDALNSVIQKAQSRDGKLFEKSHVTFRDVPNRAQQSSMISILCAAKRSKLKLILMSCMLDRDGDNGNRGIIRMIQKIMTGRCGSITEIEVQISHFIFSETSFKTGNIFNQRVLNAMSISNGDIKKERSIMKAVTTKSIDKGEKWIQEWLVFDRRIMKKIGLQRIDVNFQCSMDVFDWKHNVGRGCDISRCEDIMRDMAATWMRQRAARWASIDQRCTTVFENDVDDDDLLAKFTVNFSLTLES